MKWKKMHAARASFSPFQTRQDGEPGRPLAHENRRLEDDLHCLDFTGVTQPLVDNSAQFFGKPESTIRIRSTSSRYGAVTQAFHWLTAALVLATYIMSKSDTYSLYSAEADTVRRIHETLGILVFVAVVLRVLWGLFDDPPSRPSMAPWMVMASKSVHVSLYALLILIPATAAVGTWLVGIPITLVGFDIPPQISQTRELGQMSMALHSSLATAILWISGAHAVAALFHHFYLRDDILRSMLPRE